MFQVSPDERTIYAATSLGQNKAGLFTFDVASGSTRRLLDMADLDPALHGRGVYTRSGASGAQGRFYFTSKGETLTIARVDPAALKLPAGAAEVSRFSSQMLTVAAANLLRFRRSGALSLKSYCRLNACARELTTDYSPLERPPRMLTETEAASICALWFMRWVKLTD